MEKRLEEIQIVLWVTLAMNLVACVAKIVLGLTTGVMAITSDGLHSLGDGLNNVIGLVCIRLAKRQPDKDHAYGYDRFEEVATLLVVSLIAITCFKVFETGIRHLFSPAPIKMSILMGGVMAGSMLINLITVIYEGGAGRRLGSNMLIADAAETKVDLWVSGLVVLCTIIASFTGWYWLDGVTTIAVGIIMLHLIWEIAIPTAKQLADAQAVDPDRVYEVIMAIEGVIFCHALRSRGKEGSFFLDCHIGVNPDMTVITAHDDVCHRVKLALHSKFPGLKSANIHIEPATPEVKERTRSIFRGRDSFGHRS